LHNAEKTTETDEKRKKINKIKFVDNKNKYIYQSFTTSNDSKLTSKSVSAKKKKQNETNEKTSASQGEINAKQKTG